MLGCTAPVTVSLPGPRDRAGRSRRRPDRAFNEDRAIHTCHAAGSACDGAQNVRAGSCRVRIERDHLAPWIRLDHRDQHFRTDAQRAADERVLGKSGRRAEVGIDICAKPPLVQRDPNLLAELTHRLQRTQRDRAAIRQRAIRAHQGHRAAVGAIAQQRRQRGIINRKSVPGRGFHVHDQVGRRWIDRRQPGPRRSAAARLGGVLA